MKKKFPIKIIENKNRLSATTSIDQLQEKKKNIRQDLSYIETDYNTLISTVKSLLLKSEKSKNDKKDPRIYWLIGEYISVFLKRIDHLDYYLLLQNKTLGKSIGVSESSIEKIMSFYKKFTSIALVDPSLPWSKYRENKVPVPEK